MNTAELYVEPILIGALTLTLLALPFAPELLDLARSDTLKLFSDVSLGAALVGIAYFVGILVDRLIDSCLKALEQHNRVRFALKDLKVPSGMYGDTPEGRRAAWEARPDGDLFPEDQYRWLVFTQAERIADSLDYTRTRIRLLRALAFLLPGLAFAGALGIARFVWAELCAWPGSAASSVQSAQCNQADWVAALPATGLLLFLAPSLYALTLGVALALDAVDHRRWRRRGKGKTPWYRAGLWGPPDTRKSCRMECYAEARSWPVDDWAIWNLWPDILAQPIVWCLVMLLIASMPVIVWLNLPLPSLLVGPVLTLVAGWAWWRITCTYMVFLKSSGQFLMARQSG